MYLWTQLRAFLNIHMRNDGDSPARMNVAGRHLKNRRGLPHENIIGGSWVSAKYLNFGAKISKTSLNLTKGGVWVPQDLGHFIASVWAKKNCHPLVTSPT